METAPARHAWEHGGVRVTVDVEPEGFPTNESAVLLAEVVTVGERPGTRSVGLHAGWNVMNDRFIYDHDLFAVDYPLPQISERDIVAVVSAGGCSPGMWADHCLRPRTRTVFLERPG